MECGDGLIVALKLGIQIADEIPGIGFVGDLRDVSESVDAFFRVTEILINEAEVVPRVGILGKFFRSGGERGASRFELLLSEQRDAEVEKRNFECWVDSKRLLEQFLCVSGALLVHVGDAERVEAVSFRRVVMRRGPLRWR